MRWTDLVWFLPLGAAISLVMGAAGRRHPREILRAAVSTFTTLVLVVGGVALAIRVLVTLFV